MRTQPVRRLLLLAAAGSLIAASCSSDASDDSAQSSEAADETTTVPTTELATSTTEATIADTEPGNADSDAASEDTEPSDAPFDEITDVVQAFVDAKGLEGAGLVIVGVEEGIVYEEYFGSFSADRISLVASSSKMISAGVLLKLQEDGLLDMDAPVEGQVDWAVGNPDITPAQLVSNSSGLVGLGPDFFYAPYLCQWGVPDTLQECGTTVFTSSDDDSDQIPPDTEFRYGGAQWQVAGALAETVSGKSWEQLIDEIYVGPCNLDSLGYISLGAVVTAAGYPTVFAGDPDGVTYSENPSIEGGAHIDVDDYAKLLLMHLRGGSCDGNQVLSQESLDTMHADRIGEVYGGNSAGPNSGYGMGWWVDRETGRISDEGAWGSVPWLDLDDGYGAYVVVEDQSATGRALKNEIEQLVHDAMVGA